MNSNLSNKAAFENLYGDFSLDYPAINSFGDIDSNYKYFKLLGLFMIIIGAVALVAYKYKADDDKKQETKTKSTEILLWIASVFLLVGGGLFTYFFYAYFYLFLPQYTQFHAELPPDARILLKNFD